MSRHPAGLAGSLSVAVALSVAAVADALGRSVPSLVSVVGQRIIRSAPGSVGRFAIGLVGTGDKPILVACIVGAALLIGLWLGPAARRWPVLGALAFATGGSVAVGCAASLDGQPVAGTAAAALLAAAAGAVTLQVLLRSLATERAPGPGPDAADVDDRRRFLAVASVAAGAAAVAVVASRQLGRPGLAAVQRAGVRLPPVGGGEAAVGPGREVRGLSRLITPNEEFFRIDEALVVPAIDLRPWRLRVTGLIEDPFELTYDQLLALPQVERAVTLACVSNEVGGKLVGTARWTGVRLADLLGRARVRPAASQVVGRSVDGFTAGFPVEVALDGRDALVALGMNGEPLPLDHGFPARLVVPGLYGFVSATKWLTEIEVTTWEAFDGYWVERGWHERAPIKVQSRIDVPRDYSEVKPGRAAVAGVAWAPRAGITGVEVRADDGPWRAATLGPTLGLDTWRQWVHEWDAEPGSHVLQVRATTRDGDVQTEIKKGAFPNGATGHHEVRVRVVE